MSEYVQAKCRKFGCEFLHWSADWHLSYVILNQPSGRPLLCLYHLLLRLSPESHERSRRAEVRNGIVAAMGHYQDQRSVQAYGNKCLALPWFEGILEVAESEEPSSRRHSPTAREELESVL